MWHDFCICDRCLVKNRGNIKYKTFNVGPENIENELWYVVWWQWEPRVEKCGAPQTFLRLWGTFGESVSHKNMMCQVSLVIQNFVFW